MSTAAELLDISEGGVSFSVGVPPEVGDKLTLRLDSEIVSHPLEVGVRWVGSDMRRGWVVGASLVERISGEALSRFAREHQLERRRDERREVDCTAVAKTALQSEFNSIALENISAGGFRASSLATDITEGDRLLVRMPGRTPQRPTFIQCRVTWSNDCDDGTQTFGCEFTTKTDYAEMQSAIKRTVESDENSDSDGTKKTAREALTTGGQFENATRWPLVGSGVAVAIQISQFFLGR